MSRTPKLLATALSALLIIAAPMAAPAAQAQSSFGSSSSSMQNFIPTPKPQPAPRPAPKPAPQPTPQQRGTTAPINQGDKIINYSGVTMSDNSADKKLYLPQSVCTVGYVNKRARYLLTAAHCAENGATIYNDKGQALGIFYRYKPNYMDFSRTLDEQMTEVMAYDTARIKLFDNVTLGNNIYSGDRQIPSNQVPIGTRLCTYGIKTQRVQCGRRIPISNPKLPNHAFAFAINSRPGDSGGPVWIENGGGYIGNLSSSWPQDSAGVSNF